ncbi:unnamed protein product [Rhodiola kirilowii]
MDLEDWEYLPDVATYLLHDDEHGGIAARSVRSSSAYTANSIINTDYFSTGSDPVPPPPPPAKLLIPIQFRDLTVQNSHVSQQQLENQSTAQTPDAAAVSNVFFENDLISKETNEFADMKFYDSTSPGSNPDAALIGEFKFVEKTGDDVITSPRTNKFDPFDEDEINPQVAKNDVNWVGEGIIGDDYPIDDDGGLNLWKLGFGGIGAICSFGVTAAAICLFIFGKNHTAKHNHKLKFQIYADHKRMNQVVEHATNFNEAMSAAVLNRAHITYGGYYNSAL